MAEKQTGPVRFDHFIDAVHADPANTQPRVLLTGFVGRSDTEGNIRIYSDPGLSQWVEAPAEAVVHSAPIADSPLGGSHVWLDAAAELKPGAAGAPAAGEEGGGVAALAGQAVGGLGLGGGGGIFDPFGTIATGAAWCPTNLFPCTWFDTPCGPIQTRGIACTIVAPCNFPPRTIQHPCPTRTSICTLVPPCPPPPTLQHPCPTRTFICPPSIQAVACPPSRTFICENVAVDFPNSIGCPPQGGLGGGEMMAAQAVAPTQGFGCPNSSTCTPQTHMPGCPNTSTCTPQTHMLGCPNTSTCAPHTQMLGCPATSTCTPHTQMLGCPNTSTCTPQTQMLGCPNTSTCTPQTQMLGCPNTHLCPPPTQYICPPETQRPLCAQLYPPHYTQWLPCPTQAHNCLQNPMGNVPPTIPGYC